MKLTIDTIDNIYKAQKASVDTMELKGYDLIEELFVDSSGFGLDSEPALTQDSFKKQLTSLLKEHGELTAKITGAGMFQVYVGLFKKTRKSIVKRISTNVLEINRDGERSIRLYDTDIVKIDNSGMRLYNGGFQTRTTSKWINKYLPNNAYLYQKNWEWYLVSNGETRKFEEGMIV